MGAFRTVGYVVAIDDVRELVIDTWTTVVAESVAGAYLETNCRSA